MINKFFVSPLLHWLSVSMVPFAVAVGSLVAVDDIHSLEFLQGETGLDTVQTPDTEQIEILPEYDRDQGLFRSIPQSIAGVDTLLSIGEREKAHDLEKAAYAVLQALNLAETLEYGDGIARAYNQLGTIYHSLEDHEYALQQLQVSLGMEFNRGNHEQAGRVMNNIAAVYLDQEEYGQVIDYSTETLAILNHDDAPEIESRAFIQLGLAYYYQERYDKALVQFLEAIQVIEHLPAHQFMRMASFIHIGNTHMKLGQFATAESYLKQANSYFREQGNADRQSASSLSLARLYLAQSKYTEALEFARNSLQLGRVTDLPAHTKEAYLLLSEIYQDMEEYDHALMFYKEYYAANDSLLNQERQDRVSQRQIRFDIDHRNRQIELLNEENELQKARLENQELWRRYLISGTIFFFLLVVLLYRYILVKKQAEARQQEQSKKIERQNELLVQMNQEKDDFMSMAAHDLRNPLSNINSIIYLMESENEKSEETIDYIDMIRSSIDKMVQMINNVLEVNALDREIESDLRPLHPEEILREVISNFRKRAGEKKIRLTEHIEGDFGMVWGDYGYMRRIIENLLSNAIKFSPEGSMVEAIAQKRGDAIEISVRDNGPGISEEDQIRMFKRFVRLSNKPTGGEPSTGVGLFTVKKLTEAMGGYIEVESSPGAGSTFTAIFPIIEPSSVAEKSAVS